MIVYTPLGKTNVSENLWTGRFSLSMEGKDLNRQDRKHFVYHDGATLHRLEIRGNSFKGVYLDIDGYSYCIYPPTPWYVSVILVVFFALSIVLGNLGVLAKHGFYYVGGAIGGAISGFFVTIGFYFSRFSRKPWIKIAILVAAILIAFLTCWGTGTLIVNSMRK